MARTDLEKTDLVSGTHVTGQPTRRAPSLLRRHLKAAAAAALLGVGLIVFVLVWFQPQQAVLNRTVNEAPPGGVPGASAPPTGLPSGAGQPSVLTSGRFRSLEHETTGRALLVRVADGSLVLRFENLDTLSGPDLHVYLSEVPADKDARAYGERFVDLGKLKGNKGNQNYPVPAGIDVTKYRSAVIWCKRFTVGFGVAPLA